MSNKSFKIKLVKLLVCLLLSAIVFFLIVSLGALLIIKTNIPEESAGLFVVISSAVSSILMTVLLTLYFGMKGIYCALTTFMLMLLSKIIFTLILEGSINITGQGIANIIFVAIFSFIGALIGATIKK